MKGTDVTLEQLAQAEAFLRAVTDPPITALTMWELPDLIRLVAWYGGICVEDVMAARQQESQT